MTQVGSVVDGCKDGHNLIFHALLAQVCECIANPGVLHRKHHELTVVDSGIAAAAVLQLRGLEWL